MEPVLSFRFLIENFPECSLIIFDTIGKPNPVPFFLVVKYGFNISLMFSFKLSKPIPVSSIINDI